MIRFFTLNCYFPSPQPSPTVGRGSYGSGPRPHEVKAHHVLSQISSPLMGEDQGEGEEGRSLRLQHDKKRFRLSENPQKDRFAGLNLFEDAPEFPHGGHCGAIHFLNDISLS